MNMEENKLFTYLETLTGIQSTYKLLVLANFSTAMFWKCEGPLPVLKEVCYRPKTSQWGE